MQIHCISILRSDSPSLPQKGVFGIPPHAESQVQMRPEEPHRMAAECVFRGYSWPGPCSERRFRHGASVENPPATGRIAYSTVSPSQDFLEPSGAAGSNVPPMGGFAANHKNFHWLQPYALQMDRTAPPVPSGTEMFPSSTAGCLSTFPDGSSRS